MIRQDQRPHFYEGQYLAADDLNAILGHAGELVARHQLGAHGWGISVGLNLVERPTPGAPRRVYVFLTPGLAVDGFGRQLTVPAPTPLPEGLFAAIPYAADLDDPAANHGTPPGRPVKVWLRYDEHEDSPPGAGFMACDSDGMFARIQIGTRFVVGDQPELHRVLLAGAMTDATMALRGTYDPQAPSLADESVPFQTLPLDDPKQRWPVLVGLVRWVVNKAGGGYFVARDVDPAAMIADEIRRVRRYAGSIAETIEAPGGAIVLRDRLAAPADGAFRTMLLSTVSPAVTLSDLVWIEGNTRSIGDVRFAGGAARFTDVRGSDRGAPLSIERFGDATAGSRALRAVIGDSDPANRFSVCSQKDNPDPKKRVQTERFAVLANGNVGIATGAPAQRLHVLGERIRLENAGRTVDLVVAGPMAGLESANTDMKLRVAGPNSLLLNTGAGDGNVGIGTARPAYKLDVKARQIKLGLEEGGGGQLVLGGVANGITLSALNAAGTASAKSVSIGGQGAQPIGSFRIEAQSVAAAAGELSLEDARGGKRLKLRTDGSEVDLFTDTNALSLRAERHDCLINWLPTDGNVGVGTGTPQAKLHVKGDFIRIDGRGSEMAYIGGDGDGRDVQIGSFAPDVTQITCWNAASHRPMSLQAAGVGIVSDAILKTNVRQLEDALSVVRKLRGVRFDWRHEPVDENRSSVGFIAQEVAEVLPEVVSTARSYATIAYTGLVPLLVEAIKQLEQQHDSLKEEVAGIQRALALLVADTKPGSSPTRKS